MTGDDIINALLKPLGTNLNNYEQRWHDEVIRTADKMAAERNELLAAVSSMLPANLCTTNKNIPDDTLIPFNFTMGELRKFRATIERAST